jgi:hypothetical protein
VFKRILALALCTLLAPSLALAEFMFVPGSFTITNNTGVKTVTDASCAQPKVILFFWTRQASDDAFTAGVSGGFGVAVDAVSDQQAMINWFIADGAEPQDSADSYRTDSVIRVMASGAGGDNIIAAISAFNSDGFAINVTTNDNAIAPKVKYVCLGGSDLESAFLGKFDSPTDGTGNESYTGVGFEGDAALFFGVFGTVVGANTDFDVFIGAAKSSTERAVAAMWGNDGDTGAANAESYISNSQCLVIPDGGVKNLDNIADFVSFDADGFTLTFSQVTSTTRDFLALVLKGTFQFAINHQSRPTSATTQSITTNFTPVGTLLTGTFATAADTQTTQAHLSIGAGTASKNQGVWTSTDGADTTLDSNMYTSTSASYTQATNPSTVAAQAAVSAFSATGLTMNFTTADANARLYNAFTFGSAASGRRPIAPIIFSWLQPIIDFLTVSEAVACCE